MGNQLIEISVKNQDGKLFVNSREVAEMTGKRHDHLLRDIDGYISILNQSPTLGADQFFVESTYESGTGKSYKCFLLTRKGCDMVANKMTGEKGILFTATYVTKFEEMEKQLIQPSLPQTYKEALLALVEAEEEKERLLLQIEENQPLVTFAETALKSSDNILVRELSKIAQDEHLVVGQNKLYAKMRQWGLILKNSTEPSQAAMNNGYFVVEETTVNTPYGVKLNKTTKVTPKGQIYIIEKLKKEIKSLNT